MTEYTIFDPMVGTEELSLMLKKNKNENMTEQWHPRMDRYLRSEGS